MRFLVDLFRFYGLLLRYCYLRVCYVYLLFRYHLLKLCGALLIEAVEIWCSIKSMSREDRIVFSACIAVSIYGLSLISLIRI